MENSLTYPQLGDLVQIGPDSLAVATSIDSAVDSSGNATTNVTWKYISQPSSVPAFANGAKMSWQPIKPNTIKIPPVKINPYYYTSPNKTDVVRLASNLEKFISDHPDRAYVTDRGHSPIPLAALEEAYKDIKFVLIKLQGTKDGWRSDNTVNFIYDGLYCFFTRERDECFEWSTYEDFRTITNKQGRGGIAAVGKMSCLMTADMIFDPYADFIRKEFFRQFPRGEFDNRSMKLNQRIYFIHSFISGTDIFTFTDKVALTQYSSCDSYGSYGGYNTSYVSSRWDYDYNPIIAFAYFTNEGIQLFEGVDDGIGWFTNTWISHFLRRYYHVSDHGEEIEKKRENSGGSSYTIDDKDEITYEGRILQYTSSIPAQLMPSSYFNSSLMLLMLLTNYLYTWTNNFAIKEKTHTGNFYTETAEEVTARDEEDVAFFRWIFKNWELAKDGNLFNVVAYESRHHMIMTTGEVGAYILLKHPISIEISKYEKYDEFVKNERLKILKPVPMEKIPDDMTIVSS